MGTLLNCIDYTPLLRKPEINITVVGPEAEEAKDALQR